jgi:hypothetical protein
MPQIAHLVGLGWKIKIQEKKRNLSMTLAKEIALGNILKKGDEVYYYLAEIGGRKALIALLDSQPLDNTENIIFKNESAGWQNGGQNLRHQYK